MATRGLPRDSGHLPTAKGLHADDRARRGARGPVRVQDARLDFREESTDFGGLAAEDPRGQAVVSVVSDLNRIFETVHEDNRDDRHEQILYVDSVVSVVAVHFRGLDEGSGYVERLSLCC